ncbi:MAG TPA: hypothetical protein VL132_05780 [Planctomycetaceae bacterium]|nr:hypothetical protein [Planctomycetaceae bacterium]
MVTDDRRGDPRFLNAMTSLQLARLEGDEGTAFALWPDLTIAYVNPAWGRFAAANDGSPAVADRWSPGASILDAISQEVRPYFASRYRQCLRDRTDWNHDYECSSPDRYRVFRMRVFRAESVEALIVINSCRIDFQSVREERPPLEEWYRPASGLILQCCDCRRFRRLTAKLVWDWVPAWVRQAPSRVSHGLCESCRAFYSLQ